MSARRRPTCPDETRRLVLRRAAFRCERCGVMGGTNLDMSHRKAKGMGGARVNQASPALYNALCRPCHAWVESHPFEARRFGWKVPLGTDLTTHPVRRWNGWVTLLDHGGVATHECSDDEGQ